MAIVGKTAAEGVMVVDRRGLHRAQKPASTLPPWHQQWQWHFLSPVVATTSIPSKVFGAGCRTGAARAGVFLSCTSSTNERATCSWPLKNNS
jgi:hypothetical protein